MSLLTPWSLLFALLALPVLALYMLRLRRREVSVPSTMLWQVLLRDRQANTPWQRLRRNLLLFLQLLLLALMVLSLARPVVAVPTVATGSVVVLLDASASMNATDVDDQLLGDQSSSRFDAAKSIARLLINGLSSDASLVLLLVNQQPTVLASLQGSSSGERQTALDSLESARASSGSPDWATAFALAAGAASAQPGSVESNFVIVSDGGLPAEGLPPLPGPVQYAPVGTQAGNLSLSALALRTAPTGPAAPELFARVTNDSTETHQVILSVYINEQLHTARQLSIPANSQASMTLTDLPSTPAVYRAALTVDAGSPDELPLDDQAFAVYQPTGDRRVLVASEEYFRPDPDINIFLEQILASLPGVQAYRVSASSSGEQATFSIPDPIQDRFDLYILDGVLPVTSQSGEPAVPGGNLLLINPPPNDLFSVTGIFSPTQSLRVYDHPLLAYVDWQDIFIAQARQIHLPTWGQVLVSDGDNPLVFVGETSGRRVAVLAFDLNNSDLPLKITYPLLFASLLDYLIPPQAFDASDGLQPGGSLSILPAPDVREVAVVTPSRTIVSMLPAADGIIFSRTDEIGIYTVNYLRPDADPSALPDVDYFAVNLFNPLESDIRVAETIQVGRSTVQPSVEQALGQYEFWPWLVGLVFFLCLVEWWVYHKQHWVNGVGDTGVKSLLRRIGGES